MKYSELINVATFGKQRQTFAEDRWEVIIYCRECLHTVVYNEEVKKCPQCESKDITIGTKASLEEFYKRKRKGS